MTSMSQSELIPKALRAAREVARRLGVGPVDPVFLHRSEHISILLPSIAVVARTLVRTAGGSAERLCRELAVARHISERKAPIVAPSALYPPGPHFHGEFGLTLWQYVEHVPLDPQSRTHMASAAAALRQIHDALIDYPGELPSFKLKIDKCRQLLEDRRALPALVAEDRAFLLRIYDRLTVSLEAVPANLVPLHGDAGPHNVLITSDGALYGDFEDASLGPREWDLGWFPAAELATFGPIDRDLLSVLCDLRSLCVSVWCWAKHDMPDKREAAEYHLTYLRERFA
jgi:hypothetical protein